MDPIVADAADILRRHPAPGLPLRTLLELLVRGGGASGVDAARLRMLLEARPDRFRVLDPWRGPLSVLAPALGAVGGDGDAWVAVLDDPEAMEAPGPRVALRVRESVRWLARAVDGRATRELARWQRLLHVESATRVALGAGPTPEATLHPGPAPADAAGSPLDQRGPLHPAPVRRAA